MLLDPNVKQIFRNFYYFINRKVRLRETNPPKWVRNVVGALAILYCC